MPALPTAATTTTDDDTKTPDDDDDDDDARRERTTPSHARNKTIDLKRENVYALVHVRARMSSSSSTMRRKRTSAFGQSEHIFTEILRNALELARGKVGGKDIMDATRVVHFETKKESEGESAIGAVRMKRKDLELFASAVKEYDAMYRKRKTNDNNCNNRTGEEDSIGLRIEVLRAANSLLDMVGVESERDMVDALLLNE
tara:strand:- start:576 stop:1178 length:603 start_codon:yes stop_codon:yes gene_type:complete